MGYGSLIFDDDFIIFFLNGGGVSYIECMMHDPFPIPIQNAHCAPTHRQPKEEEVFHLAEQAHQGRVEVDAEEVGRCGAAEEEGEAEL